MRIHNLYADASGQSHFRDIQVEWIEERRGSKLSKRLPATGIIFLRNPGRARHRLAPGATPPIHYQSRRGRENNRQRR